MPPQHVLSLVDRLFLRMHPVSPRLWLQRGSVRLSRALVPKLSTRVLLRWGDRYQRLPCWILQHRHRSCNFELLQRLQSGRVFPPERQYSLLTMLRWLVHSIRSLERVHSMLPRLIPLRIRTKCMHPLLRRHISHRHCHAECTGLHPLCAREIFYSYQSK